MKCVKVSASTSPHTNRESAVGVNGGRETPLGSSGCCSGVGEEEEGGGEGEG